MMLSWRLTLERRTPVALSPAAARGPVMTAAVGVSHCVMIQHLQRGSPGRVFLLMGVCFTEALCLAVGCYSAQCQQTPLLTLLHSSVLSSLASHNILHNCVSLARPKSAARVTFSHLRGVPNAFRSVPRLTRDTPNAARSIFQ